jgi:hypothetical protein
VSALPKPEKRAPKPRRRIARTKAGRGKRTSKRRATRTQLRNLCDELFSVERRLSHGGRCFLTGAAVGQALQCAHLVSRRYLALRWDRANAWGISAACHVRYTHDPLAWDAIVEGHLGEDEWTRMKSVALRGLDAPPLYDQIVPLLVDELEAAHRAVPYDALTEGLHERARDVLAKAGRLGFEVMR